MTVWVVGCSRSGALPQRPISPDLPPPAASTPIPPVAPVVSEPPLVLPPIIPAGAARWDRWLTVEAVREGATVGCATGGYDRAKNKITIETEGVLQFCMDTGVLGVDFSRPVVLRIDGYNSQLLPRDTSRLHLRVIPTGDWELVTQKKP